MSGRNDIMLIAPCGMNCGVCMAYLREKNRCSGCSTSDVGKPKTRWECKVKNCGKLENNICPVCEEFPCKRLKQLDKRYRAKYNMSMTENLLTIKSIGLEEFAEREKHRWACRFCGGIICVHTGKCRDCGKTIGDKGSLIINLYNKNVF